MSTVDNALEDPFALPEVARAGGSAEQGILRNGRYMLPWADGSKKPYGFMRVSNLVSAYSDQFGLRMWELGEVLQGVAMSSTLYVDLMGAQLETMTREERKAWVEKFIEHAKEASGGNAGSNHGSMRHASVEALHAGLGYAHRDAGTRRALALYSMALERHGLIALPGMQERVVLVEELEACGTLDNVLGQVCNASSHAIGEPCPECFNNGWTNPVVGDLKTQRRFWTWLEIKAQQACYNHATAMWDRERGIWVDMPPVSREVALVLWMPRQPDPGTPEAQGWEPHVDIWEVDTVEGWETAKRAYAVVQDRAKAKSTKTPGAWLRPAPPMTDVERYAARFAAVDTIQEGRALVAECRAQGVWCTPLAQAAQDAYDRITVPA